MTSVMTAPKNRIYISSPNKYIKRLSEVLELDHGLLITELNPLLNGGYVQTYFKNLGFHTIRKTCRPSRDCKSLAYVLFSTEDEANQAYFAGPHYIGGTKVEIRRIVSPKIEDESGDEFEGSSSKRPPLPSVGLGYTLEDPQWLEEEDKGNQDAV